MCKTWKVNGFATERYDGEKFSDHVRRHAHDGESRPPRWSKKRLFGLYLAGRGGRFTWYKSARARDAALALFTKRGVPVMRIKG
jgi:hypothetical protein